MMGCSPPATLTTAQAAERARVTAYTIRHWCRYGAVAAVKQCGRWVVDATSLTHRIAISQLKKSRTTPDEHTHTCGHPVQPVIDGAPDRAQRPCWRCQVQARSRAEAERRQAVQDTYGAGHTASKAQRRYLVYLIRQTPQPPPGCPSPDILDVLPAHAASTWIDRLKTTRAANRSRRTPCECASGRYGGACTCC